MAQNAEVCTLLARLGDAGITQPKQVMSLFAVELHPLLGLYVPVELWSLVVELHSLLAL